MCLRLNLQVRLPICLLRWDITIALQEQGNAVEAFRAKAIPVQTPVLYVNRVLVEMKTFTVSQKPTGSGAVSVIAAADPCIGSQGFGIQA